MKKRKKSQAVKSAMGARKSFSSAGRNIKRISKHK